MTVLQHRRYRAGRTTIRMPWVASWTSTMAKRAASTLDRRGTQSAHALYYSLDLQTNRTVETIAVGGHPIDVAAAEDAVWVSVANPGTVLRIAAS